MSVWANSSVTLCGQTAALLCVGKQQRYFAWWYILLLLLLLLLLYLRQLSCHSVAAVLTQVQSKQLKINTHKRKNTKNTVQTTQNIIRGLEL